MGFSRRYQEELLALDEDIGACNVIRLHQNNLLLMPTNDHGVLEDIDRLSIFKYQYLHQGFNTPSHNLHTY